jgi:hypothetical protein
MTWINIRNLLRFLNSRIRYWLHALQNYTLGHSTGIERVHISWVIQELLLTTRARPSVRAACESILPVIVTDVDGRVSGWYMLVTATQPSLIGATVRTLFCSLVILILCALFVRLGC